jgi:hypothetical protein
LNKKIAEYFLTDARDFIKRYNILEESSTHLGLRSKLLIELIFSVECALKALIFIESDLNENETYKKAKKLSHNVNKLLDNIKPNSRQEYDRIIKTDLSKFAVYNRYQLESEIDFRESNGSLGRTYYDTIADPNWMKELYKQINHFVNFVNSKIPKDFEVKNINDIDVELEIEKHNRLKNIR